MSVFSPYPTRVVYREQVPGGRSCSLVLRRGFTLRLVNAEGGANVAALFYNAAEKLERYNMADTLKAQHTAFLTRGHVLYSDMGRILCSITEDTCGWHDTFCGVSDAALVRRKYGEARYQEQRNAFYRNGRDLFLIELGKWGLGKRDLVANVNFFSKVSADAEGKLSFHPDHAGAGSFVDLRAEMDALVVINTAQHPLDPNPAYAPAAVELSIRPSAPIADDDPCRVSCAENARGFINTEALYCQE